jgi:hypothetical protein
MHTSGRFINDEKRSEYKWSIVNGNYTYGIQTPVLENLQRMETRNRQIKHLFIR